jgi:hypothetical protein
MQNASLLFVKAAGTYSYHLALSVNPVSVKLGYAYCII